MKSKKAEAVAYLRAGVGTDYDQYESISTQMDTIESYADKNNIEIKTIVDCLANEDAEFKLAEVLGYCQDFPTFKYVLVSDYHRISRNAGTYLHWKTLFNEAGAEIKSVSETYEATPVDTFMENMSANLEQMESQLRSEQIKEVMRHQKATKG